MKKSRKKFKFWKKHSSHGLVRSLLSICLVLMIFSQLVLTYNRMQIKWSDQKVINVMAEDSGELIIATDLDTNKAGAMNYQGETVIPFENSVFNPWTGEVITEGLHSEKGLYWIIQDGKVGIVNAENKVIIPREYGYLERGLENHFIAGTGTMTEVVIDGGQYLDKKYGVIAEENKILIPLEYDELSAQEDNSYRAVIYEETKTITRIFRSDGTLKDEREKLIETEDVDDTGESDSTDEAGERNEIETETEAETGTEPVTEETSETDNEDSSVAAQTDQSETSKETESVSEEGQNETSKEDETQTQRNDDEASEEESGQGTEGGEADIQEYESSEESYTIQEKYNDGKERTIHYDSGVTRLEVKELNNVLAEFPGIRTPDVNEPVFSDDEKLVLDNWEDYYSVYSARDGQLLCSVESETDYQYSGELLAFLEDGVYSIKNLDNRVLFTAEAGEEDRFMNSALEKPRFVFQEEYFVYQSDTGRTLVNNQGVVIAEELDVIYYNNDNWEEEEDDNKIFICEKDDKFGAFSITGEKVLDFIYDNAEYFTGHVKGLRITDDKGKIGVTDNKGNLMIPIEYDNVGYGTSIQGADSQQVETYTLLDQEGQNDRYYGQKGNEIYYLDESGKVVSRVQYVARQEKSGGGFFDLLTFKKHLENRILYRITGNQKVMCNAFGNGFAYRRIQLESKLSGRGITFVCIDTLSGRVGIFEYVYGSFGLMGYQQELFHVWLISSRLFLFLLIFFVFSGISYQEIWWRGEDALKGWRQKHGKKK